MGERARTPSRRRLWLFRIAAATMAPLVALSLLELGLHLSGFGYPTSFFLDGARTERPEVWIDNANFGRWFFPHGLEPFPCCIPFALPKAKAERTCRVFIVGESAAMGFPDPWTNFGRVLETILRDRYSQTRFEIINTAMVAMNSHLGLPIARQCLEQKPDLLIIHLGNNEVVGPFGAAGVLSSFSPSLGMVRTNLAIKTTRTGQLFDRLAQKLSRRDDSPKTWKGMATFASTQTRASDERLKAIYAHHEANLRDICQAAIQAGVPVILCTIPVNLRDCAPFGSMHDPQLDPGKLVSWEQHFLAGKRFQAERQFAQAIEAYRQAQAIDPAYAELAFRLARCYRALGDHAQALRCFEQARDLDVLRFRTDSKLNQTIRAVAAAYVRQGVRLADAEQAFAEASPGQAPGDELFLEHVHMTFAGNYLLARTVYEALRGASLPALARPVEALPVVLPEDECRRRLARTEWDELRIARQMSKQLLSEAPFTLQFDHAERSERVKEHIKVLEQRFQADGVLRSIAAYEQAIQRSRGDWILHLKFGDLLLEVGNLPRAKEQFQAVLANLRHSFEANWKLGMIELRMNRLQSAEAYFREAIMIEPTTYDAYAGLGEALQRQGRDAEALAVYEELVRLTPNTAFGLDTLGQYLARTGKLEEAAACFREAVTREPQNPLAHANYGNCLSRLGKIDEAIEQLEAALRLQPDWPEAQKMLSAAHKLRERGSDRRPKN
jgi:tetratricopeptide (TPR) repeat protein